MILIDYFAAEFVKINFTKFQEFIEFPSGDTFYLEKPKYRVGYTSVSRATTLISFLKEIFFISMLKANIDDAIRGYEIIAGFDKLKPFRVEIY